jgi:hypothetical protein
VKTKHQFVTKESAFSVSTREIAQTSEINVTYQLICVNVALENVALEINKFALPEPVQRSNAG